MLREVRGWQHLGGRRRGRLHGLRQKGCSSTVLQLGFLAGGLQGDFACGRHLKSQVLPFHLSQLLELLILITTGQQDLLISCANGHVRQGIDRLAGGQQDGVDVRWDVLPSRHGLHQQNLRLRWCLAGQLRHRLHHAHCAAQGAAGDHLPRAQARQPAHLRHEDLQGLCQDPLGETSCLLLAKGAQVLLLRAKDRARFRAGLEQLISAILQRGRNAISSGGAGEGQTVKGGVQHLAPLGAPFAALLHQLLQQTIALLEGGIVA
mmetsp:Transcript_74679/g.164897  ORF Transcript_74679/g.164897 Transcript_74679/m.164897 type:complete len:263 (-) Transcript_74679:781-1569(-)